jgi:hypothetical protein
MTRTIVSFFLTIGFYQNGVSYKQPKPKYIYTNTQESMRESHDKSCSIDILDFNEILPVCSRKWDMKALKISASKTLLFSRYWIHNRGILRSKMTIIDADHIHCWFHHLSTMRFKVMKLSGYILPSMLYILTQSKSRLIVLESIARSHKSYMTCLPWDRALFRSWASYQFCLWN